MYQTLLTHLENGVFTITINRPDKLNALNKEVFNDLDNALDEVYANTAIQSVLITGAGTKAFVAGADISEFAGLSKRKLWHWPSEDKLFILKLKMPRSPLWQL
jgi:enoyl-CoA hydratase